MRIVLVHLEISAFILIRHSRICLFVLQQEHSVSFSVKLKCGCSKYDLKFILNTGVRDENSAYYCFLESDCI